MEEQVMSLMMQDLSCAQILVKLVGLDPVEKENEDIINAMGGMRYGMGCQSTCGCVIGAVAGLSMHLQSKEDRAKAAQEICTWFADKYGGLNCEDILGPGNPANSMCPQIMAETAEKCFEILGEML